MNTQINSVMPVADAHPRICMHAPSAVGGHPLYVQELLTALSRHPRGGERFELVSGSDLVGQFRTDAYPVHAILPRLPRKSEFRTRFGWVMNRLRHYPQMDRLFLEWARQRPDIAGVHFQEFSLSLARLCRGLRRLGKTVFYTVHNIRPHAYPPIVPRRVWDGWNRQACLACDRLIVHTERLRDDLSTFLGQPHPPIDITPHGVWQSPRVGPAPTIDERLGWKRLLFFGTIRRNKGLDLLLDAAGSSLRDFSFTIAGEAREADYFRNEVRPRVEQLRAKGVSVNLIDRFVPENEVGPLFASHSAIVLPYTSQFTAQSGVVFLALAHELPVVASNAGGIGDLFDRFTIGVTYSTHTPDALAAAVRACFAGAGKTDIARNLRAARECFSWEAAAAATLASYAAGCRKPYPEEANDRVIASIAAHQHA